MPPAVINTVFITKYMMDKEEGARGTLTLFILSIIFPTLSIVLTYFSLAVAVAIPLFGLIFFLGTYACLYLSQKILERLNPLFN